jgi:hypothetical protein
MTQTLKFEARQVECVEPAAMPKPRSFSPVTFNLLKNAGNFLGQEAQILLCAFYTFERSL